jgi:HlyD family secretion protein
MSDKAINTNRSLRRVQFFGFLSLIAMVVSLGGWSVLSQLNGAVIAQATLVAETYTKKVQHKDGGVIERILVVDGDRVSAGQELVILDPTETRAELGISQGLLDEALIKRARLEAQRDFLKEIVVPEPLMARVGEKEIAAKILGQNKLLSSVLESVTGKKDQLLQQVGQLREQISGFEAQATAKKKQVKLIGDELVNLRKLQKDGLVPINRVLAMERETAQLEGEIAGFVSSKASAESRIGEIKLQIIQVDEEIRTQTLTELRDLEARIIELQERTIAATARLGRMIIKSPITGTIYQSQVHTEGGVIAPGETLMLLTPEGDDLVLQAQVLPNDIDQVSIDSVAKVRFPSFNAQLTPEITAVVSQVASDVSRTDQNTPPFYAVRLRISAEELKKLGKNKLKPGMTADAFIQTSSRTPFSYLVKPLWDNIAHTFTEG